MLEPNVILIESEEKLIEVFGQEPSPEQKAAEIQRLASKWMTLCSDSQDLKVIRCAIKMK